MKEKKGIKKIAVTTIASTIGGLGLGILLAPKKGRETRRDIRNKIYKIVDKIKTLETVDTKKELDKKIKQLENEIKNLTKEKNLVKAKKRAMSIKVKMDDLEDLAEETDDKETKKIIYEVKKNIYASLDEIFKKREEK